MLNKLEQDKLGTDVGDAMTPRSILVRGAFGDTKHCSESRVICLFARRHNDGVFVHEKLLLGAAGICSLHRWWLVDNGEGRERVGLLDGL